MKTVTLVSLLTLGLCHGLFAKVVYVDDNASAGGDGTSWASAHKYLQDAAGAAVEGDKLFPRKSEDPTSNARQRRTGGLQPGELKWEFETGGAVYSSPAIGVDGTIYVGSQDNKVYALDGQTGTKQWEFETGDVVRSSPAIGSDGTVYIGSFDNKVYALSGKTGTKIWQFATGNVVWASPAIGADGTIYIGSFDNKVYALNGKTGTKIWQFAMEGHLYHRATIGNDGTVYIGEAYTMASNKVYALEGNTGAKKWEFVTGSMVEHPPVIGADGTVYVGSLDNKVYALDGQTGAKQWEFATGDKVEHGAAIGLNGTVYIGSSDNKFYALNGQTGAKQWEFVTGDEVDSSPAIGSDGIVYFGSLDHKFYALDGQTGTKQWEFETGDVVRSSPAIGSDGTVYVGSYDNKLYAIQGSSGPADSPWPMFGQNAMRTGRAPTSSQNTDPETSHQITITSILGGFAIGSGTYKEGVSVDIEATANTGYLFTGWSGDATGTTNPLTITVTSDLTITANFGQDTNDDDGDGLINYAELITHGTDNTKADTDGDGLNDKTELDAGGDPKTSDAAYIDAVLKHYIDAGQQPGETTSSTPFVHGWFYYPNRGWMYTKRSIYPYFYDSSTDGWMYFRSGEDKPRFYHYGTKTWVTLGE
jgi:uncharacterized repeat protein (TIGR02543 family)